MMIINFEYFWMFLFIIVLASLSFLYRRFNTYKNEVARIYKTKIKEMNNAKTLLDHVIGSIDNLIFVKDKELRYITCNKSFEEFIGKSQSELIGKNDYTFFPKELADYFSNDDKAVMLTGVTHRSEKWISYPNGENKYLLTTTSPLRDSEGAIIGLVGNAIDVTHQKKLEQELTDKEEIMLAQSRQAAMGEMISMIAHQWRQPLSSISMGANNILADIELDILEIKTLKETTLDIVKQTQELSKTIDDFRNFFKLGKEREQFFLKDIFEESYEIVKASFTSNNIEVTKVIQNNIQITTYPRELKQVILNILNNAQEAFRENNIKNKHISIFIEDGLHDVTIKICDNAKGIAEMFIGKIFEPYFSTKSDKNGTGLGLYISKTIVEKHLQGSIQAYNKDDGACFEIKIPQGGNNNE